MVRINHATFNYNNDQALPDYKQATISDYLVYAMRRNVKRCQSIQFKSDQQWIEIRFLRKKMNTSLYNNLKWAIVDCAFA